MRHKGISCQESGSCLFVGKRNGKGEYHCTITFLINEAASVIATDVLPNTGRLILIRHIFIFRMSFRETEGKISFCRISYCLHRETFARLILFCQGVERRCPAGFIRSYLYQTACYGLTFGIGCPQALIDARVEAVLRSVRFICLDKYVRVSICRDEHIARYHAMQGGRKRIVAVSLVERHIDRSPFVFQEVGIHHLGTHLEMDLATQVFRCSCQNRVVRTVCRNDDIRTAYRRTVRPVVPVVPIGVFTAIPCCLKRMYGKVLRCALCAVLCRNGQGCFTSYIWH